MKKIFAGILILLILCGCDIKKEKIESKDLKGTWIIDVTKSDVDKLKQDMDKYPGFDEWGASMEINGKQLSFYIGALSYEGEYLQKYDTLIADLKNLNDETLNEFNFKIIKENSNFKLQMIINYVNLYWIKEVPNNKK